MPPPARNRGDAIRDSITVFNGDGDVKATSHSCLVVAQPAAATHSVEKTQKKKRNTTGEHCEKTAQFSCTTRRRTKNKKKGPRRKTKRPVGAVVDANVIRSHASTENKEL